MSFPGPTRASPVPLTWEMPFSVKGISALPVQRPLMVHSVSPDAKTRDIRKNVAVERKLEGVWMITYRVERWRPLAWLRSRLTWFGDRRLFSWIEANIHDVKIGCACGPLSVILCWTVVGMSASIVSLMQSYLGCRCPRPPFLIPHLRPGAVIYSYLLTFQKLRKYLASSRTGLLTASLNFLDVVLSSWTKLLLCDCFLIACRLGVLITGR